jgi:cell division protease FtsH
MGGGGGGGMGGGNNPFEMGKSKAKLEMEPNTGVKFVDVAGCDGSKLELTEVRRWG